MHAGSGRWSVWWSAGRETGIGHPKGRHRPSSVRRGSPDPTAGRRPFGADLPTPPPARPKALAADQAACQIGVAAPERRDAEGWLSEVLSDGPVPAKEVDFAARNAGIAGITLRRAEVTLGVLSVRQGFGKDSTYLCRLADTPVH
jgi:hypothetical protein